MSLFALALAAPLWLAPSDDLTPFDHAVGSATRSLESGDVLRARAWIWQALERDPKSIAAWDLRARWAEASDDADELVYSLHRMLQLGIAQKLGASELRAIRDRLNAADPLASDLLSMREVFIRRLLPLAVAYEKDRRPHSAIDVYREVLALDPEHAEALAAIERITSQPDPSLAEHASEKDLFADVSDEWIRKHDRKHAEWGDRAKFVSEYYNVYTDAGYRILVQAATAMDQMHLFYKRFFGVDGSVARIDLNIFKSRDGYLKKGIGPPVEWSGGHFTGGAVETYVDSGGFQSTLNTLFHEAAHQFVNRATSAGGWLNEGLASFFEGTRLLPNGTVLMNLPANHYLFELSARLERGWMEDHDDGISRDNANQTPRTGPRFDTVLENKYAWGPPWYAPTWGVVFFCYNYQDATDGRFVYRDSFLEFLNKSGGRTGGSAVGNFEEVVLANPSKPTPGTETSVALPATVAELNELWKQWLLRLRDEQLGTATAERPYLAWGEYAVRRKEYETAAEHFDKGLAEAPDDIGLLREYAMLLADELKNEDRAVKLVLHALRALERSEEPDEREIARLEKLLHKWDDERRSLDRVHEDIWASARGLVQRYLSSERYLMTMDLAWRLSSELNVPGVMDFYEEAWRRSGKSLHIWTLAYNEKNLEGWSAGPDTPFRPNATVLESSNGRYSPGDFRFATLPLDLVTSGDYSMEVDVLAASGSVGFAGIVFGMKSGTDFNALIYLPGKGQTGAVAGSGFIDLASFYGGGSTRTWRHVPVVEKVEKGKSSDDAWVKLRLDVTGSVADVYLNGELKVVHEFPSREVVAGSLGLITSQGEARYRNVRYLTRSPRDPGARLERDVKMQDFGSSEQSIGGSWLGKVPPFPKVQKWVQGERKSWQEVGPVPQLLAMFSIRQNDLIGINDWLSWLKEKYSDVGLEVVAVGSVEDTGGLERYLSRRPFPGAVALDGAKAELGDTFEDFAIGSFNLPRLILLDIDGRVVWEGDPGLSVGTRWSPGVATYLDGPLEDLVTARNLRALGAWRREWKDVALPALHDARMIDALPALRRALEFDARGDSDVFDAHNRVESLKSAVTSIESTIEFVAKDRCDAALEVLLAWAEYFETTLDKRELKRLKPSIRSKATQEWEALFAYLKSHSRRMKKSGDEAAKDELLTYLESLEGRLPALVLESLDGVAADEIPRALDDVKRIPELWLAREYFRW